MSAPFRFAIIGGDGIGPEVVRTAMNVLNAASSKCDFKYEAVEFPFSAAHFLSTGHLLDDNDIAMLRDFDAIFLGAVGGVPNDPRLANGVIEKGILLKLRFDLDQYINLRPIVLFPGVDTPLRNGSKITW